MQDSSLNNIVGLRSFGLFAVYIFALIVIFLRPLDVQHWQWVDDALYFNNAKSIISNMGWAYWLGPFDRMVISKAPFFSVFIATIHFLGVPLRLAEFFLFAPLPFLFWQAVRPLQISKWMIIYSAALCVVCIPIAGFDSRLLRTTLSGALSLYCMISLTGIIIRSGSGKWRVWPWAVSAGLASGLAATTREEALWLILPTSVAILLSLFMARRSDKFFYHALVTFFVCIGYFFPVTLFSILNYNSYGVYSPSLRQNPTFRDFYSILCSLQPDQRQKYMPIITKTRELAYTISPHFAQLRPYLEGPALDYMARNKEHHIGSGYGNMEEREFFWYNFEFALTEAIFLSGYQTGQTFLNFCRQATREIQTAIDNGKIEQGKLEFSMPMLPPLKLSEAKDIFWASLRSFWILIKGKGQYRYTLLQTTPLSDIATEWHSFLMTWPYPSSGSEHFSIKLKNCLFNVLVNLFTINYPFLMIFGLVVGGRAYLNKCENYSLILSMLLISWSALFAFCFMMGVVDTIAFPTLQWPEGHNITGFFPLHFLLLISVLAFSCTLKPGISWKLPTL